MRKAVNALALLVMIPAIFIGCSNVDPETVRDEFVSMLIESPTEDNVQRAEEYLKEHLGSLTPQQTGEMLVLFEDYAATVDDDYFDYEEIVQQYGSYIPQSLREFYELKELEQENPVSRDGMLTLSWQELLDRALRIETFIRENLEDPLIRKNVLGLYAGYINTLLTGASNTPVFDYETHQFSEEARSAYEAFVREHPKTTLAWVLNEYRKYLEAHDYMLLYKDREANQKFFSNNEWLISEAQKRVYEQ